MGAEILYWISQHGYIALLPLFIIEGPVVGIASGVLISFGVLKPLPVFLLYISGTFISDSILYFLSRDGDQYLDKVPIVGWSIRRIQKAVDDASDHWKQRFKNNYFSLMVFARLAPVNLVSEAVVVIAGALKIPTRKFYAPVLLSQPIWSAAILAIGYYFGDVIADPKQIFREASIVFVAAVCLFLLYRRYMHQYLKQGLLSQIFNTTLDNK